MKIEFTKMTGAGNDFVVIDNRSRRIANGPRAAKQLCDRRWGIGADGLLLLESSRKADYRMMYYNADGSYGGMCGNGGRCIALYALRNRIAPAKHSIEALDYVYKAVVKRNSVTLWMKPPKDLQVNSTLRLQGRQQVINFVDTGAPHVVVPIDTLPGGIRKLEDLDVFTYGRAVRQHPSFAPQGTNANFVQLNRDKSLKLRTYERGVENETLACGTGSIAVAIIAHKIWGVKPPVKLIPRSGVPLIVNFRAERGEIEDVRLTGPAQFVFQGAIDLDLKIPSLRRSGMQQLRKGAGSAEALPRTRPKAV